MQGSACCLVLQVEDHALFTLGTAIPVVAEDLHDQVEQGRSLMRVTTCASSARRCCRRLRR
jgi:hypothetical protein